jgi:hypothetical protein
MSNKTILFLKGNKILLLVFIVIALGFYWYSYRPYLINKTCIVYGVEQAKEIKGDQSDVRYFFWKCQMQYGG